MDKENKALKVLIGGVSRSHRTLAVHPWVSVGFTTVERNIGNPFPGTAVLQ